MKEEAQTKKRNPIDNIFSKICQGCQATVYFEDRKEYNETAQVLGCDNCLP